MPKVSALGGRDHAADASPAPPMTALPGRSSVALEGFAGLIRLQRSIGNRALTRLIEGQRSGGGSRGPQPRMLLRLHSDEELLGVMQKFRKKNDHLPEEEQNKISWAIKKATDSDEVAYAFFDYYSGFFGRKILPAEGDRLANMRKSGRVGETSVASDSYFLPEVLQPSYDDAKLGPVLLHEFSHTGHMGRGGYGDFQEGQSYAVEYFYAERTGATARTAEIERYISGWSGSDGPAVRQLFKVTYAVLKALQDLKDTGSSSLPPLVGKTADDGRTLAAALMKDMADVTDVPPKGPVAPLWSHVKANLGSFKVPPV